MKHVNRLLLWLFGCRVVKPVVPEAQVFEFQEGARYLVLADARWVTAMAARQMAECVPHGSKVWLINCSGDLTPKDVVQLFKLQA